MKTPRTLNWISPLLFALVAGSLVALSTFQGCSTSSKRGDVEGERFDESLNLRGQEGADYKDAQALFSKGDYEKAIAKLTAFEKRYSRSQNLPYVRNLKGMCYLLTRKTALASQSFRRAIETSSSSTFKQYVAYNLASSEYELNKMAEVSQALSTIRPETLDRDTRIKYYALKSKVALKNGRPTEALPDLLALSMLFDERTKKDVFTTQLEQSLQDITDPDELLRVYNGYENSPFSDSVLFRLGQLELAASRVGLAETHLKTVIERYPNSPRHADALDLLRAIRAQSDVNSFAVGVLVPTKGRYARFGQRTLQGIQLAFGVFNSDIPDNRLTLVVEDSGEDPETAIRALNTLVFKHKVVAVIGPLLSKGVDQIAARAQELGVPLISLSQQIPNFSTLPGGGDFVTSAALTPQSQARTIAQYAMGNLGMKRFAMLYPRDRFGEQYSNAFWDAVESQGGKMVGVESYTPGETDFRAPIDKISGTFFDDSRKRELDELSKIRDENEVKKRNRKTEKFYALPPLVDYDAVFIPDEPKVVGQILPTFAYRDVSGVKFLGTATWHSPELISRAQNYAEGALFVDAFFPESGAPAVARFVARFRNTFNSEPAAMEAIAYDAGTIVEQTLTRNMIQSRADLKDKLRSVRNLTGATGVISYENGLFNRLLQILTIRGGQIAEAK